MSVEAAVAFMKKVGETPELQARLDALTGIQAIEALCNIAADAGFQFTPDEYREAVVLEADGGLSDEAIEQATRDWGFPTES